MAVLVSRGACVARTRNEQRRAGREGELANEHACKRHTCSPSHSDGSQGLLGSHELDKREDAWRWLPWRGGSTPMSRAHAVKRTWYETSAADWRLRSKWIMTG